MNQRCQGSVSEASSEAYARELYEYYRQLQSGGAMADDDLIDTILALPSPEKEAAFIAYALRSEYPEVCLGLPARTAGSARGALS